jgi:hypothetical protein
VPQCRHEDDGFPVAERHVINQSHAAWGVAVEPHHVGVDAGLLDKNQPGGVQQALLADPPAARPCLIGSLLSGGAQALFLAGDAMTREERPQRAPTALNVPRRQGREHFRIGGIRPLLDQRQDHRRMLLQGRGAAATRLRRRTASFAEPLKPFDRGTRRDLVKLRRLARDAPDATASTTRSGKSPDFGTARPPARINAARHAQARRL